MRELVILNSKNVDPNIFEAFKKIARQLMPDVHQNRINEWSLARCALHIALQKNKLDLSPEDYVFKNFHELGHLPSILFSVSHSKNWAAAIISDTTSSRHIGLDIELKGRVINDGIQQRMHHKNDDTSIDPLELWSIKEACYKALPSSAQEGIWLNHIAINKDGFELSHSPLKGNWELVEHDELIISEAIIK
jgi:4'-phosphopantetheinyl transferase EntD